MKEQVEKRIQEIEASIHQLVNQHTQLMGHLNEAKFLLQTIFKAECEAKAESEVKEGEVITSPCEN